MKRTRKDLDTILDRAAAEIRNEAVDAADVAGAAARVRVQLAGAAAPAAGHAPDHNFEGCADFQSLVPAYLSHSLSEARVLLFEDHVRECVPCRKAVKTARTGEAPARQLTARRAAPAGRRSGPIRLAIAAALVAAFGVLPVARYLSPFGGLEVVVEAAEGSVYEVGSMTTRKVESGDRLERGERIRTSREAGAVLRLDDGSRVELRERSELEISEGAGATTIRLGRGNIIVQPAASGSALYVAAPACLVTVDGATVSVNSGTKGTRVSAIEGTARVAAAGSEHAVAAGEQFSTSASIAAVPVAAEVSWSRDADRYAGVLAELAALRRDIDATALAGELRYDSRLLDLVPADTAFYAAIPNFSSSLAEANRLLEQRVSESPALRQWWASEHGSKRDGQFGDAVERLAEFGAYLGPEVVVALSAEPGKGPGLPVVLAELADADGFRAYVAANAAKHGEDLRVVDDPAAAGVTGDGMNLWIHGNLLAASPAGEQLVAVAAAAASPDAAGFRATPFRARLAEEYREGVAFLVAADLARILPDAAKGPQTAAGESALERLGVMDVTYFVAKSSFGERSDTRAVLSFDRERRGIASWLAAPGPMGALDYISPDANVVAAFVLNDPAALVDDLFGVLGTVDPQAYEHLRRFEQEHGVDLRDGFAAPLGGEFAFAVDGPILPTPSWKMVIEVNDPERLQQSFEQAIAEINTTLAAEGKPGITQSRAEAGGRAFYAVASPGSKAEVHYAFADGYMIVAPSQALVDRAIRYRESGYTLTTSPRFAAALPADGNANFSALLYHDLAPLLAGVADKLPQGNEAGALGAFAADSLPTLAFAYARADRIELAATGDGGPFGLSPATLLGAPGSMGLQGILQKALKEH